ncbi:MAG TPA: LamG-like jellyroll fold domain-containing protein [Leptolyngbyaceae cyanobacterium]
MADQQCVLSFDGQDDSVNLGRKPEYKVARTITLEAWICASAQKQWAGIITNIYDTGGAESGYGLLLDGGSGFYFGLKLPSSGINYPYTTEANTIKLNQWHHIAGTYDGQQMKLYVDGVEKIKKEIAANSIDYSIENDLLLGMYKDNDEFHAFPGKITEVRLWNVARSAEEIKATMNQRLQGNEAGLVGYWPLNECSGEQVTDQTGKGNNGTINGATWVREELPIQPATTSKPEEKQPETTVTPQVEITHILYKGEVKRTQSDEYVEITNQEDKPVDISGWQIASGVGRNKFFTFPAGTTLTAGQKVRVYTNEVHPETGGFSCGSKLSLWKDTGDEAKLLDAKGNLVSGLAYDSKGNFTKITNEQTSEATFESVKAELGVPNLKHNINDADVKAQTTPQTKVSCVDAFRKALKSFIEDGTDDLSAFAEVREFPSMYDLPDGNNDAKVISEKVRETLNNHCHIKLLTLKSQDPEDNEYSFWKDQIEGYADRYNCPSNLNDSWIFVLDSNKFNNYNCAVVDKAGAKPTVNWGFLYG